MSKLEGVFYTVFFSFFIALTFAFIFRFPIPMGEMIGPFGESVSENGALEILQMVFFAWFFYGVLGGFIVLSVLGGIAGHLSNKNTLKNKKTELIKFSFIAALIPLLFISTLDFFIGPW